MSSAGSSTRPLGFKSSIQLLTPNLLIAAFCPLKLYSGYLKNQIPVMFLVHACASFNPLYSNRFSQTDQYDKNGMVYYL